MTQPSEKNSPDIDSLFPGMPVRGWMDAFPLPKPDEATLASFENLPFDIYAPNAQRYRRFAQYVAFLDCKNELTLDPLLHRPFAQSAKHNSYSGGILREFAPIEPQCNIKPYIKQLFNLLKINNSHRYQLDIHQYRVYATPAAEGIPVPEGIHRDGMDCVAILVIQRQGITPKSAEFSLIDPNTRETFFKTVVGAGQGILLDDKKMLHDASPILAAGDEPGYRDYFVVNINDLDERRYGRAHERNAAGDNAKYTSDVWDEAKDKRKKERLIATANTAFARAQRQLDKKNINALNTIRAVQDKLRSLGSYDGLSFSPHDLVDLTKSALVMGINNNIQEARLRRVNGGSPFNAVEQTDKKLAELRILKGGIEPDENDGLTRKCNEKFLALLRRDPPLWELQKRAQRPEYAWVEQKYPHATC